MKKLTTIWLFSYLAFSTVLSSQTTPAEALLVLAKQDHTLAIVDPTTLKVITRVPVGEDPHEVIASADGKTAYVSNYGFGRYDTLAVVDLAQQKRSPSINLGPLYGPHGLAFVGGKVWFTAEGAKAIGRYDPDAKKVDWILGTGQNRTHMIFVADDRQQIITTNVASGTVSIIDRMTTAPPRGPTPAGKSSGGPPHFGSAAPGGDWNETVVRVGNGSEGFDVSPDGKEIWVANAQDGTISIIDRAHKTVIETLSANVPSANRLKFTLDGKLVLVSMLREPDLAVFNAATRKEIKRVPVGHGSAGILMQPDGGRAFVACSPDNYVAVVDLKSLEVVGHIDAGRGPDGLAWASWH
ncbi:MAG TPA: hypothetical protein VMB18_09415 [Terriglobales bacterium]|nr:hypothetical protein [Terriglobales bacterium]